MGISKEDVDCTALLFLTADPPPALHTESAPFLLQNEGPVYKLAFGPRSFIVVSDPVMAKHVLKSSVGDYDKGVLASVSGSAKKGALWVSVRCSLGQPHPRDAAYVSV